MDENGQVLDCDWVDLQGSLTLAIANLSDTVYSHEGESRDLRGACGSPGTFIATKSMDVYGVDVSSLVLTVTIRTDDGRTFEDSMPLDLSESNFDPRQFLP